MSEWEILKRWATYWQRREPGIIALMGLSSCFDTTLIPTAVPVSAQSTGCFLWVPPKPVFLWIWDLRSDYNHSVSVAYRNTSSGMLKALLCSHLSHSIPSFCRWSQAAYLLLQVISPDVFSFTGFLFLTLLVFLRVVSVQSNPCHFHASHLYWEHTFQACIYPSKVSQGEPKC